MKLLAVHPGPDWSVADIHVGWVEAFWKLGVDVLDYPFGRMLEWHKFAHHPKGDDFVRSHDGDPKRVSLAAARLIEAACYRYQPDVVLFTYGATVPPATMQLVRSRHYTIIHHTESPYEDDRQIALAAHGCAHLHLINDPTNLDKWRAATDDKVFWQPNCYRPSLHHPHGRQRKCDVAWVGSMWPERFEWWRRFLATAGGLEVALGGNFLGVESSVNDHIVHDPDDIFTNEQGADLYRAALVGVNTYRRQAQRPDLVEGWAMSPREVEMAMCGLPYVTEARGEHSQVIPLAPVFEEPEGAADLCRWLCGHPDEAGKLAEQAASALADRTFYNSARHLLGYLDKEMQ